MNLKKLLQILPPQRSHWVGNGFHVTPLFGDMAFTNDISPFLMLDYGPPKSFAPTTEKRGVGRHPHRGFETVTIAFQGEVEHGDSSGNHGVIGAGDVQWMTAASGIVHEEFHSLEFAKKGGMLEMVQLWVNLPAKYKFDYPKYQPIINSEIPSVPLLGSRGEVRIIAGEYNGVRGAASTYTPINIWDVHLPKDATADFSIPIDHNSMLLVRSGAISHHYNGIQTPLPLSQIVMFEKDGTEVRLSASEDTKLLLLTGTPLDEPIAARGPFVLNTEKELRQAMVDYETGRFLKE